jgi:polyisoprenoid-binding protein YceI
LAIRRRAAATDHGAKTAVRVIAHTARRRVALRCDDEGIETVKQALIASLLLASVATAEPQTYEVVSEESRFVVNVGRAGLFKMFGHDHVIRVRAFTGLVEWDAANPGAARFELEVVAGSLEVADEELSDEDRAEVQQTMETEALDLGEHPAISFASTGVEVESSDSGEHRLTVRGELALRGVRRELEVPVTLTFEGARLVVSGEYELESDEWGVPQISVAGGTVKTSEDLDLEFEIVAR